MRTKLNKNMPFRWNECHSWIHKLLQQHYKSNLHNLTYLFVGLCCTSWDLSRTRSQLHKNCIREAYLRAATWSWARCTWDLFQQWWIALEEGYNSGLSLIVLSIKCNLTLHLFKTVQSGFSVYFEE